MSGKKTGFPGALAGTTEYDYLSADTFRALKGCFVIFIMIHHLFQFSEIFNLTSISFVLYNLGYWGVAGFMFISGYGLRASLETKGEAYVKSFPGHRILPLYLTYSVFVIIYFIYDLITVNPHSITEYITTMTYGGTIVSFGWYIQEILLIYLIYWLLFRFLPKEKGVKMVYLLSAARVMAGLLAGQADMTHTPAAFFALGFFTYYHRDALDRILKELWIILFPASMGFFFGAYLYMWRTRPTGLLVYVLRVTAGTAFLVSVLIVLKFIMYNCRWLLLNPFFLFLGKRSLEIYACQGLVLKSLYFLMFNRYLYAAVCAVFVVMFGSAVKYFLDRLFQKLL